MALADVEVEPPYRAKRYAQDLVTIHSGSCSTNIFCVREKRLGQRKRDFRDRQIANIYTNDTVWKYGCIVHTCAQM